MSAHEVKDHRPIGHGEKTLQQESVGGNVAPQDVDESPNRNNADGDGDVRALATAPTLDRNAVAVDNTEDKSGGHERDGGDPSGGNFCAEEGHNEEDLIGDENGGKNEAGSDVVGEHAHDDGDSVANNTLAIVGGGEKDTKDVPNGGESNEDTNPPAAENDNEEPGNHPPKTPVMPTNVMPLVPHLRHPSLVPGLVIRKVVQDESDVEDKEELGNHPPNDPVKPKRVMPLIPHLRHPSLVPGLVIPLVVYDESEAQEEEDEQKEAKKEAAEEEEEDIEDMYTELEYPQSPAEETNLCSDTEGSVVTNGGNGTSGYASDYEDEPTADEVTATGRAIAQYYWVNEEGGSYNADEEQTVESEGPEDDDEETSSSGETDSQLLSAVGSGFNTTTDNTRETIPTPQRASGHYYSIFRVQDSLSIDPQGSLFRNCRQEVSRLVPRHVTPPSANPGGRSPTTGQISLQGPRSYPFTFAYPAPSMAVSPQDFLSRREATSAPAPPHFALPPASSVGRSPAYFTTNQAAPLSPLPYPFTFTYQLPSVEETMREVGPRHRMADVPTHVAPAPVEPSRPYSRSLQRSQAHPFGFRYPPPTGMYWTPSMPTARHN